MRMSEEKIWRFLEAGRLGVLTTLCHYERPVAISSCYEYPDRCLTNGYYIGTIKNSVYIDRELVFSTVLRRVHGLTAFKHRRASFNERLHAFLCIVTREQSLLRGSKRGYRSIEAFDDIAA